jgi:hypothetical protein
MDHIVYVDKKAEELKRLLGGEKTMIVRGATGRKLPYDRVQPDDRLFFVQNNGAGMVTACAVVSHVLNSDKLTESQSKALIKTNQSKLQLTTEQIKRWSGKRYLVLIEVKDTHLIQPFGIDRTEYGNMDDWLPVGEIESVKSRNDQSPIEILMAN